MIFDMHAHIYPDKVAVKASKSIEQFYDIPVANTGDVSTLLARGREAGVDRFLVHSVATTELQVEKINDFIIAEVNAHPDRFTGFGTLHPDYAEPGAEIDRMLSRGLKGIKLHPDFQEFMIDDERAFGIYEAAEGRLPILFHMGDRRYEYSKAKRLLKVINRFPGLQVIGAHLGGYSEWDEAAEILGGTGIYVDTSSSLSWLEPEHARRIFEKYGMDRVMFASDYPMWNPKDELTMLNRIPMSVEERKMVLWDNAARLLEI